MGQRNVRVAAACSLAFSVAFSLAAVAACGGAGPDHDTGPRVLEIDPSKIEAAARLPPTCTAPFVLEPPARDRWVELAAKQRPAARGAWWTRRMQGPFASRSDAAPGCATIAELPAAPPYDTVVHCATGDRRRGSGPENLAQHMLVVHTKLGWWSQELGRDRWPHGGASEEFRQAGVVELAAADRFGDGAAEITAIAEEGPPGGAKNRRLIVCGAGPSTLPSCADIRFAAGGPSHGPGTLLYRVELDCDGTLSVVGWEGGVQPKLVHGRGRVSFQ